MTTIADTVDVENISLIAAAALGEIRVGDLRGDGRVVITFKVTGGDKVLDLTGWLIEQNHFGLTATRRIWGDRLPIYDGEVIETLRDQPTIRQALNIIREREGYTD